MFTSFHKFVVESSTYCFYLAKSLRAQASKDDSEAIASGVRFLFLNEPSTVSELISAFGKDLPSGNRIDNSRIS